MLNEVILMGRLTRDPELRVTASGKNVATYTLAVYRDKDETDFIPCVVWDKGAEFAKNYLSKGKAIIVQGRLQSRPYEDKDGNKRTAYEVVVRGHSFCESKKEDSRASAPAYESPFKELDDAMDGDLPF